MTGKFALYRLIHSENHEMKLWSLFRNWLETTFRLPCNCQARKDPNKSFNVVGTKSIQKLDPLTAVSLLFGTRVYRFLQSIIPLDQNNVIGHQNNVIGHHYHYVLPWAQRTCSYRIIFFIVVQHLLAMVPGARAMLQTFSTYMLLLYFT